MLNYISNTHATRASVLRSRAVYVLSDQVLSCYNSCFLVPALEYEAGYVRSRPASPQQRDLHHQMESHWTWNQQPQRQSHAGQVHTRTITHVDLLKQFVTMQVNS